MNGIRTIKSSYIFTKDERAKDLLPQKCVCTHNWAGIKGLTIYSFQINPKKLWGAVDILLDAEIIFFIN